MAKELYNSNQTINDDILKHINDALIELKRDINVKINPENENPKKIFNIVEKIINFDKQQKGKGRPLMLASRPSDLGRIARTAKVSDHLNVKILTLKQMLQRIPIPLAQVKADNTSENLLNEIRQIIHPLY